MVEAILEGSELFLDRAVWENEGKRALLQVFIDSPKGVQLDDCVNVSRQLSAELDLDEDLVPGAYDLQVSSPGLTRALETAEDFRKYAGRLVVVEASQAIQGRRKKATGILLGIEDEVLRISLGGADATDEDEVLSVALDDVVKARLEIQDQPEDAGTDRRSSQREVEA